MKRQDNWGVGSSIFLSIVFAGMAILTYQSDPSIAFIPVIGVLVGIVMAIKAANKAADESAKKEQQEKFSKSIVHDSSFGNGDIKIYFDTANKKATICATTAYGTSQKEIEGFVIYKSVQTDEHLVALDSSHNKILSVKNNNGNIVLKECCINDELKEMGIDVKPTSPTIKPYNDYAFITDDINEFIAIVTPANIHVLRYSDIVSISYEENGSNVFNKSLGGAVVGGLLFGGVGAIVGGNTAKATQNKEIRLMTIKILLKSTSNSTIILNIYEAGKDGAILETKKSDDQMLYEGLMKEVSGIKDIFSIIIDIVDKDIAMQKTSINTRLQFNNGIADELTKLVKLKESGYLSEEEFNIQKTKLLNR